MEFIDIVRAIKDEDKIIIMPHISVDGDGLGSSLALALALRKIDKDVFVYLEEEIPQVYNFMKGMEFIKIYNGEIPICNLAIALDTGDLQRLGKRKEIFQNSGKTINIDHHISNSLTADWNFVNTNASATGEIIYKLIKELEINLDKDIAECLYVAISTDTGGFKFSNTTPETLRIAAGLIEFKINFSDILKRIYDTNSMERLKLIEFALSSLEVYLNGKVSIMTVTDEEIQRIGAKESDLDGIVNYGRSLEGVEVAVLLKGRNNKEVKVNLRSNEYVDVAGIASLHNGGGHKRAAGCVINESISKVKELLINDIEKSLEN